MNTQARFVAALAGIMLVFSTGLSCQFEVEQQEFRERNGSDRQVSVVYGTDSEGPFRQHYEYYSNSEIGSIDKNDFCALPFCNLEPRAVSTNFYPFREPEVVFFVARTTDTNELIFYEEFSLSELKSMGWLVPITDQR